MSLTDLLYGPDASSGSVRTPSGGDLSSVRNSALPTADLLERQLKAESGGRHTNPDGSLLTSSAGAQGISQVMPKTGVDPGFGVAPLRDQSEGEFRRFQRDYMGAMLNRYGGDQALALGAYNWGPGNVDRVREDPNWLARAPQETQDYVNKVLGSYEERGSGGQQAQPQSGLMALLEPYGGPQKQAIPTETTWGDRGRELGITAGSFAQGFVGTAENVARLGAGEGNTPLEQGFSDLVGPMAEARRGISNWQQGLQEGLTPEAQRMGGLEWDNLGDNSIWTQGVGGFVQAASHQALQSLGPTIGPMVLAVVLNKVGVPANVSSMFGMSEGLMSAGLTASQIADNIDRMPTDELRAQSPRFAALYDQFGEAKAREQFITETMGYVPLASGALTGMIAKGVGGKLDKVFGVEDGLSLGKRVAAGATTEIGQEVPQSYMEQVAQNYAERSWDPSRPLTEGALNAAIQGGVLAGPMGGGFAGAFGSRPRGLETQTNPVAGDIERAIRETTGEQPRTAAPREAIPQNPLAPEPPATTVAEDPGDVTLFPNEGSLFEGTPFQPWDPNATEKATNYRLPKYAPDDPRAIDTSGFGAPQQAAPYESPAPQFQDTQFPPPPPPPGGGGLTASTPEAPAPFVGPQQQLQPPAGMELAPPQPYEANVGVEPVHGQRTRTEMLGYRVRVTDDKGQIVKSQLFEGRKGAEFFANRARTQTPDNWRVEMFPARRTFRNDQAPEPEPVQDILAQTADMQSGQSQRLGVYLTRETMENLDSKGQLDSVLKAGVPINNFDTYGGVLVAKDEASAQHLMQLLETGTGNIDEVLGLATGAGFNKPYGGPMEVIQRIDENGSVVQESLVRPEEAKRRLMEMGPNARKVSMEWAMNRRKSLYAADQQAKAAAAAEAADQNARAADLNENFAKDKQIAGNLEDVTELVDQGGSRTDVGTRLMQYATDVGTEEKARRKIDKDIPAPEDVSFRGKDLIEKRRQATADRRKAAELKKVKATQKEAEDLLRRAEKLTRSVSNSKKVQGDINAEYKRLYDELATAALRVEAIRTGLADARSLTDLQQAQAEYDDLKKQLTDFIDVEGGYTKSAALMAAATRFAPEAKKGMLRAAAQKREAKQQAAITQADEEQRPITQSKVKDGKLLPGETLDTPDVPVVGRLRINPALSVATTAARLRRIRKITRQPNAEKLIKNLREWLDPNSDAWKAQPGMTLREQEEHARALIELNQLLRQWMSDYKLALGQALSTQPSDKLRNRKLQKHIAILIELQGQLRGENRMRGTVTDAAEYVAHRIADLVIHGKRWGVASDLDIDGFWKAQKDGPVPFRNYLNNTVASRDGMPLPLEASKEQLQGLTLGQLNSLYVKAIEILSSERESNGLRTALVDGIMEANGDRFSRKIQSIEYSYAPRNRRGKVLGPDIVVRRDVSPYTLMRETLINSYGVRGADKAMSLDQLRHLYTNGGTAVEIGPRGGRKTVEFKAAGKVLPTPLPLSVRTRRLPASEKIKVIQRAIAKQNKQAHGGKSDAKGMMRRAGESPLRYNPNVLVTDSAPREAGAQLTQDMKERRKAAIEGLKDALSSADVYLASMNKWGTSPETTHAKAYFRWLVEYANALRNAHLVGAKGLQEIERVTEDLTDTVSLSEDAFVKKYSGLMAAEQRSQVAEAGRKHEELRKYRNKEVRAKSIADQHDRVRRAVAASYRLHELWKNDPDYQQVIAPILQRISESIQSKGYPDYTATKEEREAVDFVLAKWSGLRELRQSLSPQQRRAAEKYDKADNAHNPKLRYDEFYAPIHRTLSLAGFWDNDRILQRKYAALIPPSADFSQMGPTQVLVRGESGNIVNQWATYSPTGDRTSLQEQYRAAQTPEAKEEVLQQIERTAPQSTAQRININQAIAGFREIINRTDARIADIAQAEAQMMQVLKAGGWWIEKSPTLGLGTITAPSTDRSFTYRMVGERLRKGQMTKAEARRMADRLKGFDVPVAAASSENLRRMDMGLEARRALDALERRGVPMIILPEREAQAPATKEEANAMGRLRDHLRVGTTVGGALTVLGEMQNSFYTPLVKLLRRVPNIGQYEIKLVDNLGSTGYFLMEEDGVPAHIEIDSRALYEKDVKQQLHLILHEAIHAATMGELTMGNPEVTKMWEDLRQATYKALETLPEYRDVEYLRYGANNLYEFVAEVFTNEALQRHMKNTTVDKVEGKLWHRLIRMVMRVFGAEPGYRSLFDVALSLQYHTFSGAPLTEKGMQRYEAGYRGDTILSDEFLDREYKRGIPYNMSATLTGSVLEGNRAVNELLDRASKIADATQVGSSSALLGAMTMRQLWRNYMPYFGGEGGSLDRYMRAYFARNAASSEYVEDADKLSRRWTKLREQNADAEKSMSELMLDATMQKIHPDVDFRHKLNEHLDESKRGDWAELSRKYQALPQEAKDIYAAAKEYYRSTNIREVQFMLANALRASKLWRGKGEIDATKIDLEDVSKRQWLERQLGINLEQMKQELELDREALRKDRGPQTKEKREAASEFDARDRELTDLEDEIRLLVRMASLPSMKQGPYFPIMRFGQYSTFAEKIVETKAFSTESERSRYRTQLENEDPTLQFNYPPSDDGLYHLTVKEVEYRLAETKTKAEQDKAELAAKYGEGAFISPVHLKAESFRSEATIGSNRALQNLLGKLEGNSAAQAAIRHFYIQSLSDRSFRKREAKRKNYRGALPEQQQRTFGAYAKAASYYTAQLQYGWKMADAKHDIERNVHEHRDESKISAVKMGQVRNELLKHDKITADLNQTPDGVRWAVETGQLYLLFSPSYWMINSTQPYMVTLPWLSGHTSVAQATAALANAQKLIADPLVTQAGKSLLGARALWSRSAAEEAFSVIENVEKTLIERLGKESPILTMLTDLKRESIIDLSFVAELRDVAEGKGKSVWARVMDATRVMAHLTEVNNRIMTAIAAYNVGISNGLSHDKATAFARDAVEETQMDYSAGNKARLFSGADAWYKPLIFQFMQYTQHMWAMTIRHMRMAFGNDAKDREIGRRVMLGLVSTHAAAGGILGVSPILLKWVVGAIFAAFGAGDDPDRTVKNWFTGDYFDRMMADMMKELPGPVSHALRKGLPTLIGADVSNRMGFLQTYMVDLNPKDAETLIGSIVMSFGGPAWGLAANMVEGSKLLLEGDLDKAAELMLPKAARDLIRASRFATEGVTDRTGKLIYDGLTPWDIFMQGIGFAPAGLGEMYEKKGRASDTRSYYEDEKARIRAAYNKAPTTGEYDTVMADLAEYNSKVPPRERISMSDLIRGKRRFDAAARDLRTYGVSAGKKSRFYGQTDDPYDE